MTNLHSSSRKVRLERIDIRTTEALKSLLAYAAEASGVSMSTFLIEAAKEKAEKIIQKQDLLMLTSGERNKFLSMIESSAAPTLKLKEAMEQYLLARGK